VRLAFSLVLHHRPCREHGTSVRNGREIFVKATGQPKLGGTTDAKAFVPNLMFGMSAFFCWALSRKENTKERIMQTKNENQKAEKVDNPIQERPSVMVDESDVLAADAVLAARRLEVQKEAGRTSTILFVP